MGESLKITRRTDQITQQLDRIAFYRSSETSRISFTVPGAIRDKNPLYSTWEDRRSGANPIGEVVAAFTYNSSNHTGFSAQFLENVVRWQFENKNASMVVRRGQEVHLLIVKLSRPYMETVPDGMRFGWAARLICDPE